MPRAPGEIPDSLLRVILADGVGPRTAVLLRESLGNWDAVCAASAAELDGVLRRMPHSPIRGALLRHELDQADPDSERREMKRAGVSLIALDDDDYPALLRLSPDPPPALFLRGAIEARDAWAVAIVGSRAPTPYGVDLARRIAGQLSGHGLTIVSGGARGIDAEAHGAALRVEGRTIAVMGCGLGVLYPPEHGELYERIVGGRGAIVSEFPMRVEALPGNFPRRNRIIAALALGVLVVEAAIDSGANITARLAAEDLGRITMAVPGPVQSVVSAGCHRLIRDGAAALVTGAADVLEELRGAESLLSAALEAGAMARFAQYDRGARVAERGAPKLADGDRTHGTARPPRSGAVARAVQRLCDEEGLDPGAALARITLERLAPARGIEQSRTGHARHAARADHAGRADPGSGDDGAVTGGGDQVPVRPSA